MSADFQRLKLRQLDETLARYRSTLPTQQPKHGWIREIRKALAMTAAQLGHRIGTSQQAISELERSEAEGTITLNSLRKAAEAMDCDLRYVLVPRGGLENTIAQRIRQIAQQHIRSTATTMQLEDQAVSARHLEEQSEQLIQRMMADLPANLWADKDGV